MIFNDTIIDMNVLIYNFCHWLENYIKYCMYIDVVCFLTGGMGMEAVAGSSGGLNNAIMQLRKVSCYMLTYPSLLTL